MRITPRVASPVSPEDLEYLLKRTEHLWEQVRGQRIFMSGGTGFFGCWILESLLAANRSLDLDAGVVVLTRSSEAFRKKCPHLAQETALELVTGDVRDFAFPPGDFRCVIHAATETVSSDVLGTFSTIVQGTQRCLEFSKACRANKFLLTSSGAVYGKQPPGISHVPEDYLGSPELLQATAAYGEGKRAAETLCAIYGEQMQMECKIARCFAFVGPHLPLDAHFAIGNFIRDAMRGGPISVSGDGTPMRSYLYAADLAVWLWTILLEAPAARAYNVGSDHAVSIQELASEVAAALDPAVEVRITQKPSPGLPAPRYIPSIRRAREELGLEVHVSLREAIRRTALWHGFQPKGPA